MYWWGTSSLSEENLSSSHVINRKKIIPIIIDDWPTELINWSIVKNLFLLLFLLLICLPSFHSVPVSPTLTINLKTRVLLQISFPLARNCKSMKTFLSIINKQQNSSCSDSNDNNNSGKSHFSVILVYLTWNSYFGWMKEL